MLKEFSRVSQHAGESFRRLFWDDYLQLYVWFDPEQRIVGFELSYDLANDWRAFRWKPEHGVEHFRVDDGENRANKKGVPLLHADDTCVDHRIEAEFAERGGGVEPEITGFVSANLSEYLARYPPSSR
jgi:hypothetical protein